MDLRRGFEDARRAEDEWSLVYEGLEPRDEGTRETLLTCGNGYMAARGAAPEARADGVHYPGTYVAGVYNRLVSYVEGGPREDESIVNLPNWLPLTFRADEEDWFEPGSYRIVDHRAALDLRRGLYLRDLTVVDPRGRRTRVRQERLVSMDRPHLAYLRTVLTPEDWSGALCVRSLLDGRVENGNVAEFAALAKRHLGPPATGHDEHSVWLVAETTTSGIRVAEAMRTAVHAGSVPERRPVGGPGWAGEELTVAVEPGSPVTVDKTVAVYTSRDRAISEPLDAARRELADAPGFPAARDAHALVWEQLWRRFRLSFDGTDRVADRRAVNVHLCHVLQTLSHHSADWTWACPPAGCTGRRTGGGSSGTSCSSFRYRICACPS
ncbi:hypothetical protein [Actinoallomurus acaciae]|uniref:Glycoside hydrolase family 65 N-terminal domain-containing protein n=1 Tax=Actinoallomurus acaciae TaxID=502577 RepID=A0ABV5YNG3_9ACTN